MIYRGQVQSVNRTHTYTVDITTTTGSGIMNVLQFNGSKPITIHYGGGDNPFDPINTISATVQLVNENYMFDLYSPTYDIVLSITDENNNVLFSGYITPSIYNQDWNNISVIDVNAISYTATLKYKKYTTVNGTTRQILPLITILNHIYPNGVKISHDIKYSYLEDDGTETTITGGYNVLNHLALDERNFFDDDEDETPWTQHDVIEEICKYLGWKLIEFGTDVFIIPIQSPQSNTLIFYKTNANNTSTYESKIITINKDAYAGNDNDISLERTYNVINIKANTYPYEEIFPDIFDGKYWDISTSVNVNPTTNNLYLPTLIGSSNTKNGIFRWYWLYYTSNLITPHRYSYDSALNRPVLVTPDGQFIEALNLGQLNYDAYAGISLTKNAMYDVQDSVINSSLTWKKQISLATGLENIMANQIPEEQEATYIQKCMNYLTLLNDGTKPLAEITSDAPAILEKNTYLVLSGNAMLSSWLFEDPTIDEWEGNTKAEKERFSSPTECKIIDVGQNENSKEYFGFPLFVMSFECGNYICVKVNTYTAADDKYVSEHYEWIKSGEHPTHISTNYTGVGYYKADGVSEPYTVDGVSYYDDANSSINIPVGKDQFSFFRFHEITNTCDWRMGLDNAKGFAIPVDKKINGTLKVKIFGLCPEIFGMLDSIRNIPGMSSQIRYTAHPDPYHFGTTEWTWNFQTTGHMPNYVVLDSLSLKSAHQTYFTFTDLADENANNKNTDHIYSNVIDSTAIDNLDDIELKINTQDSAKNRSFSSALSVDGDDFYYVDKMTPRNSDLTNYPLKIQEENIIDCYKSYYSTPKVLFNCELKDQDVQAAKYVAAYEYNIDCISPFTIFEHTSLDKNFLVNGLDKNLFMESANAKLYEFPVVAPDYSTQFFTIESLDDNNEIKFYYTEDGVASTTIYVSTNNGNYWYEYHSSKSGTRLATLNAGKKLLLCGVGPTFNTSTYNYSYFGSTGRFNVKGNIMSLLSIDFIGQTELTQNSTFANLFENCDKLISAEDLIMPATTLKQYCYSSMFQGCTSLTTAPAILPATSFNNGNGYWANYCYNNMFSGCTSLTTAPELPATTLALSCYRGMFSGCTSLIGAPELPATTLADTCYTYMFTDCTSLNYIKCLATDISANNCTTYWVENVASTGLFIKPASMSSWTTGENGIPSGWTVQDA